ncbi:MAG: AAA family ATPase [Patescibacteria group bacterium]|nr:AAA family ATPase [Patescibacteria group bacterium]
MEHCRNPDLSKYATGPENNQTSFQYNLQLLREYVFGDPRRPLYVWMTGPAAAGKTSYIESVRSLGAPVTVYSEGTYLLDEVAKDTTLKYHTVTAEGGFLVTGDEIHGSVLTRLVEDIGQFQGDICLIDLVRGQDREGKIDLSYFRLVRKLPEPILRRSAFVFIYCPYEERLRRNELRDRQKKDSIFRRTNPASIERYFQEDRLDLQLQELGIPYLYLDNSQREDSARPV